jgi:hypothetical protein
MRRTATDAIFPGGKTITFNQFGMSRQAQVVITAEVQVFTAIDLNHGALGGFQGQALAIEPVVTALRK